MLLYSVEPILYHLEAVLHIIEYLKYSKRSKIVFD